jgi:hypothetical protein
MDIRSQTVIILIMNRQGMDTIIILFIMAHLVVTMVIHMLGFTQRIPPTRIMEVQLPTIITTQQAVPTQMLLLTTQVVLEESTTVRLQVQVRQQELLRMVLRVHQVLLVLQEQQEIMGAAVVAEPYWLYPIRSPTQSHTIQRRGRMVA